MEPDNDTIPLTLQQRIPLEIQPYDNVLKNIRLKEPIELTMLDRLIHCPTLLKDTFDDPVRSALYKGGEVQLLEHYRDQWRQGWCDVQYTRNEKIDYGRFLPSRALGLHNIRRKLRHSLADEWAADVDIANAHPEMLRQIKTIHNITAHYLDEYCDHRDIWLNSLY